MTKTQIPEWVDGVQKRYLGRRGWGEANADILTPAVCDFGKSKKGIPSKITENRETIPLFFAVDDNYLPFLSIALKSIRENSSRDYDYRIYVLHSGLRADYTETILRMSEEGFEISFENVTERLKEISSLLHMRDYYTCTTYFRIFIAGMFPQYDKALYLDSDMVILGDIAELYHTELGDNLVAAAPCEGVNSFEVYKDYVRLVGGLNPDYYFNAGMLLMNLKAFREENFYGQFAELLKLYKFTVIQDEDYLNVLCQDRVLRLPRCWNKTPVGKDILSRDELRIVHFLMTWKPWRYTDIPYQEYFWEYAEKTEFYPLLKEMLRSTTYATMDKDVGQEASLAALAQSEIDRADGYFKVHGKRYGK